MASACRREGVDVVLPVSEDATRALATGAPDLGSAVIAGPTRSQYEALCDKGALVATTALAGVDHPDTLVVAPGSGKPDRWPALPSIVKPAHSGELTDAIRPAVVVTTGHERDAALAALSAAGLDAIVQKFLTGRRWSLHGVRSDDAFLSSAVAVLATWPRDAGTSSVMRSMPPPPGLLACARRLLDAVGYVGPFSFNVIDSDGSFVVHDVNLRLSASVGITIASGLDVPRLGVEAALGTMGSPSPHGTSRRYVSSDGEVRALTGALRRHTSEARESATQLALGVLSPRRMVDPPPADPFWMGHVTAAPLRTARRHLARALRKG